MEDAVNARELEEWKWLTEKLLKNLSTIEVVDYVLMIAEDINTYEFLSNVPLIFYDNGKFKPIKDKEPLKKYKKGSGITAQIVSKIRITDKAKQYGLILKGNKCKCCFHEDKDPSLVFNDTKGTFKCWSSACGKSGNIIDFVRLMEAKNEK
jgi:hypothetical protein